MNLAQHLAQSMADGHVDKLPRLTRHADPEFAQDLLLAYYRLRDTMQEQRAQEGAGWSLRDRIAASSVVFEIESAISDTRAWLSRVARRGGRGVLPPGCRGGTPAAMPQGRGAFSSAVGPAHVELQSCEQARPADGSFFGPERQELPVRESVGHEPGSVNL